MEIEALKAMNEGMYLNLLVMFEIIALITVFLAIAGFTIYLAGIAWRCFEEMRQPTRSRMKIGADPPGPDKYDPLATLAALDGNLGDSLTGGVSRREPAL